MYQRQAQGLASLGRGPDTELVHMTKNEVNALDDLAKGLGYAGLPTNPQTGLPEAGIFDSLAPILIGAGAAALAPFTGGGSLAAFLSSPLLMGGTAALGAGIASGFDLSEMAKYGLGVASGASIAGGLGAAGSAPTGAAAGSPIPASNVAGERLLSGTGQALTEGQIQQQAAKGLTEKAAQELTQAQLGTATRQLATSGADPGVIFNFTPEVGKQQFAAMGKGLLDPKLAAQTVGKAPLFAGAGSLAADAYGQEYGFDPVPVRRNNFMPYPEGGFMPPERTSIDPFQGIVSPLSSEERLFFDPGPFTSPGFVEAKQGGMLTGLGDGMSDDIMLPIKGAEKGDPTIAAVSTDEFIVPADVVSGLGNGSSSAGAKQLYAMMDRVRDKRTGKESQPQEIKARKMLPA